MGGWIRVPPKKVIFLLVLVCLSVRQQDYLKVMNGFACFYYQMSVSENNPLHSGDDPDYDLDPALKKRVVSRTYEQSI